MTLPDVCASIPVDLDALAPPPGLFLHASRLHGQPHVARVVVHALNLVAAVGCPEEAPRVWAAAYLHDLARRHDGYCTRHGADAWLRLPELPAVASLFHQAGVSEEDCPAIEYAVTIHCQGEPDPGHPHYRLAALLKDADGLDRVRLYDLNPKYLRHEAARTMVTFARQLYERSHKALMPGPAYFSELWPIAMQLLTQSEA